MRQLPGGIADVAAGDDEGVEMLKFHRITWDRLVAGRR
jgi:hypothetical protein